MGLFKLAVYGTLAYVAYQVYQGVVREAQQGASGREAAPERNAASTARQAVGVLTGPAGGMKVETHDPSGTTMSHRVGRGVVTRGDA